MWWYQLLRPAIRSGYQPLPMEKELVSWVRHPPPEGSTGILAFCPTVLLPDNAESQTATIREFVRQLAERPCRESSVRPALLLGLQYSPGEKEAAANRAEALIAEADAVGLPVAAFLLQGFGKVRQVNVAIRTAIDLDAEGLLQVDDDIRLEPGCIAALIATYRDAGRRGVVGATKRGIARRENASRLLTWLKRQTGAAVNYPHACCMVFQPRDLPDGIPHRYISDDGFLCFHFLRPNENHPFRLLRLAQGARCVHFVGGPAGQSFQRIQRLLKNHHVYLADFPVETSRVYLRASLVPGFWPVGVAKGYRPLRWMLQSIYFVWFFAVGIQLALHGIAGIPLREIRWAGFTDRDAPNRPARETEKVAGE